MTKHEDSMTHKTTTAFIKETSRDYSIYVCQSRGIPSASDGLKDAQRKALDVMKPIGDKIKTISLAGLMISSNKYLHGDAAAADTISLMAAPYCNNIPLLSGVGAFGTRIGPGDWGAPRYTYVKKNQHTESLIYQDHDIIPLKENYDGSVLEPQHFLPLIPMVLLNGVSGIAVGWSTEILPRSLSVLIDATVAAIDGKKTLPDLMPCYDYLKTSVRAIGDNAYEFTGQVTIDGSSVLVTELPPDLSLEKFKARLNKLEDEEQIQTYVDRSTKEIMVEVRFKRGTISSWTPEKAIDFLKLRTRTTERLVVLDWDGNNIRQYDGPERLIREFVDWRIGFYTVRFNRLMQEATSKLNWNLALKECHDQGLSSYLQKAKNRTEIIDKIIKITSNLGINDEQVSRIAALPSYRWAKDAYEEIIDTIAALRDTILEYQQMLDDPEKMRGLYRKEVLALKKLSKIDR
jgi:DNA gyrase/topoisomerase IV subunit A